MTVDAAALLDAARAVRVNAYAVYSGFRVGAALLDGSGRIHLGVNVENASYGVTLCAEQVALGSAITAGANSFQAIAVAGPREVEPCPPCGRCRQLLHEFAPDLLVIISDSDLGQRTIPLSSLLPEAFGPEKVARVRDGQ